MKRSILYILFSIGVVSAFAQTAQTLTVAQCRQMALQTSEDYRKQDNAQAIALLNKKIARNGYLPQFDLAGMALYTTDNNIMGYSLQMRGLWFAGIQVTQPVYVGGKLMAANRLAKIGVEAAREQTRLTHDELLADADRAYYTLLAVREKIQMLRAYARQMDTLLQQVETSVNAQMATDGSLLRVQAKQSEINYQLQKVLNGEILCQMALCSTVGLPLETQIVLADSVLDIQAPASLSEDISSRPELELLRQQIKAKEQQVKMNRAGYLPQVGLSLGYSYIDNLKFKGEFQLTQDFSLPISQTYHKWMPMALLSVKVPVFHWTTEFKKVKQAKLEVDDAKLDLQKNQRLMSIEAKQAVENLTDCYTMIQTADLGRRQADENLRVMQLKYDNGMATLTDLLDAQSQWQQARSNLIEAQTQYKIYETEYLRVTGGL